MVADHAEQALQARAAEVAHTNFMDSTSYAHSKALATLRMAAASCFFGEPQYYEGGKSRPGNAHNHEDYLRSVLGESVTAEWQALSARERIELAIDQALDENPEGTLQVAVALRNEDFIRVTPQVIMVRAAYHPSISGTGLIAKYAPDIMKRADEPATQLAYVRSAYAGRPIVNSLRKAWSAFLEKQSEYSLAKYRLENRTVKTVDVVNLVRPKATDALTKLVRGELTLGGRTWESLISEQGSNKETWSQALDEFLLNPKGHAALLKNLANLVEVGLASQPRVLDALRAGAPVGKQLPFRYFSAYQRLQAAGAPEVLLDAVEDCLNLSIGELPQFKGRVMSLADNSGSAQGATTSELGTMQVNKIANLTAVLTGMASDEGHVGVFGDELEVRAVRKRASVFEQLAELDSIAEGIGQGTENGVWLFFEKALREKEHWDHVFVYSDMQAGHGGLYGTDRQAYKNYQWPRTSHIDVAALIREYHRTVNKNCKFYLVQVAGYQDSLAPDFYPNVVVLGGWGPGLLRFAHAMGQQAQA